MAFRTTYVKSPEHEKNGEKHVRRCSRYLYLYLTLTKGILPENKMNRQNPHDTSVLPMLLLENGYVGGHHQTSTPQGADCPK